jgi:crotonobetainyl-CoA:carnitine CoA-transferase CaiB-like acyl-CoA transferase
VDARSRRETLAELTAVLDAEFARDTTENWLARLRHILPAAPVYDIARALDNPFVQQAGMIQNVPHPRKADFRALANPIKFSGQRLPAKVCSALGADTEALLREAGLSEADLARLHGAGAITR